MFAAGDKRNSARDREFTGVLKSGINEPRRPSEVIKLHRTPGSSPMMNIGRTRGRDQPAAGLPCMGPWSWRRFEMLRPNSPTCCAPSSPA